MKCILSLTVSKTKTLRRMLATLMTLQLRLSCIARMKCNMPINQSIKLLTSFMYNEKTMKYDITWGYNSFILEKIV